MECISEDEMGTIPIGLGISVLFKTQITLLTLRHSIVCAHVL